MRLLSTLVCTGVASAVVLSRLPAVPQGFVRVSSARPDDALKLWVSLKHAGVASLAQKALDIATPGHADHGKHLSNIELRDLTAAPSADALEGVTAWLASEGVRPEEIINDVVVIRPTVRQAKALLGADFAWYQGQDHEAKLRTLSYGVPDAVADWVSMIQPTTRFGGPTPNVHVSALRKRDYDGDMAPTVTPEMLKNLYNIHYTVNESAVRRGRPTAFGAFWGWTALDSDFQRFQDKYLNSSREVMDKKMVNGGVDYQNETDEYADGSISDGQVMFGISHPTPIREYVTGDSGPDGGNGSDVSYDYDEPYLGLLTYLLNQSTADLPQVLSISYGEDEQTVPDDYALQVCNMFMLLGVRGVSVLFSSGDAGPGTTCPYAYGYGDDNSTQFTPQFPASCPWVTAVGSTNQTTPERAANFSGGGFSTLYPRPSWQNASVSSYLAKAGGLNAGYFNSSNRAVPDVAAMGTNVAVFTAGQVSGAVGTSVSTPVFAGVVAMLNAARETVGLGPLGFLNPFLYAHADAFNDLTDGKAFGCWQYLDLYADDQTPTQYWEAVEGWDTVTGLGSPDFGKLLAAAAPGVPNS